MFDQNILNHYVDSYKLQIEILELYKVGNKFEQKFLQCMSANTFRLIEIIEIYVIKQNKYNDSFLYLKQELENSLKRSYLSETNATPKNIFENFQNLITNIEKTLKLSV